MSSSATRAMRFTGHVNLRQRLVLSLLSGKPLIIRSIRPDDLSPGLRDFEASFLRLLEKLTNGTVVEIGYTGTELSFRPGTIMGGEVSHECGTSRPVGYFLEWIAVLAPFAKKEISLTLKGITNGEGDLGADILRTVTLPILSTFLPDSLHSLSNPLELRITKRGSPPLGGGQIFFRCPLLPSFSGGSSSTGGMLRTIDFTGPGKVKKIRGIATAMRVSPQMANRMVDAARGVLNRYVPDLYLFADVYRGEDSGRSPGFSISLISTSTTGALQCSESISTPGSIPEDVALLASRRLLVELSRKGGCFPRSHQAHVLLLMALGPEDVGRALLGSLTPAAIQMMRDLRDALGVRFKIRERKDGSGKAKGDADGNGEEAGLSKRRAGEIRGKRKRGARVEGESEEEGSSLEEEEEEDEEEEGKATRQRPTEFLVSCIGAGIRGSRKAA